MSRLDPVSIQSSSDPGENVGFSGASNLTKTQFLIWMGQKLNPEVPLYNMVLAFTIKGAINCELFRRAFRLVVDCSDALRTIFEEIDDVPTQRVLKTFPYEMEIIDLSESSDPQSAARVWEKQHARKLFCLEERLFESALLKLADNQFVWFLNQHHLITDGWSTAVIYRRMADFYRRVMQKNSEPIPAFPAYQHYVQYETTFQQSPSYKKAVVHWRQKAENVVDIINFYGRSPLETSPRTERVPYDLGRERSAKLKRLAGDKDIRTLTLDMSLFYIFSTILFAFLYRISGNRQISIGTPSHNRSSADFKNTVGLFIEIFPLVIEFEEGETFQSLIKKVRAASNEFLRYALPGTSGAESNKAFNVILNFINTSFPTFNEFPMQSDWIHPGYGDKNHILRLQVHDFDNTQRFLLHFDLNCDVFEKAQRERAVQHFLRVLDSFLEDKTRQIDQVNLLSEEEKKRVLFEVNPVVLDHATRQTVVDVFESQVNSTPDKLALVASATNLTRDTLMELTYREFDTRINQMANYLKDRGVGRNVVVGIYMDRSLEMLVALYGVLKAGGTYLPLEPSYPMERLTFMLNDAQVKVVVTQHSLKETIENHNLSIVDLKSEWEQIAKERCQGSPGGIRGEDIAYVIYTSGSTGNPKGVMISHANLVNYVLWAKSNYLKEEALDLPLFSSPSFDLTVTSIFVPLIAGGKIVVYDQQEKGGDLAILRVIQDDAVDVVKLTPSHLALFKDKNFPDSRLKKLILGGEDLKTDLARTTTDVFGGDIEIYNEYGPTETTVGCMIHKYDPREDLGASVPIGKGAAGAQIYVLDSYLNPVPEGVVGEIYISSPGVARGYLNRPSLTQEKFIANPFTGHQLMYRTGDMARWNTRGDLEYVGRFDHQVKIRGARVELGEIEGALLDLEAVQECVVHINEFRKDSMHQEEVLHCRLCGLSSRHPEAALDVEGICKICRNFALYKDQAMQYFGTMDDLKKIFENAAPSTTSNYDCLMLLSGGKDSTYVLYKLVEMGLNVLVFSLDNGFISEGAKKNIRRVVDDLKLDLVFGKTPAMNAIFVDSLNRFSNVCNGCFKTIYTLSMNLAKKKGIKRIVTGLSRGQIFETRLADIFRKKIFDINRIDRTILEARKAYHRMDDEISRSLDVNLFTDDAVFQEIQFVDFYRYCDVKLDEMLDFLEKRAPWIRPEDTGRSTNCLINEVGIYVHKKERGFHNYALPYSWDVRLGHKTRDAAIAELDDQINTDNVQRVLREIGYGRDKNPLSQTERRLVAYYTGDVDIPVSRIREHLSKRLPDYMIPSHFKRIDKIPLTANGKINRNALPTLGESRPRVEQEYVPPRNDIEEKLAEIWGDLLGLKQVGVQDNFFDLGGDSIINIQIVSRANQAGLRFSPKELFDHPTIAALSTVVTADSQSPSDNGVVSGSVPLTPIQHWFFDVENPNPNQWNHTVILELLVDLNIVLLKRAVRYLLLHHDALRLRFDRRDSGWKQFLPSEPVDPVIRRFDYSAIPADEQDEAIENTANEIQADVNIADGKLLHFTLFELGSHRSDRLLISIHHLAVDGVSWWILLEDLETVYRSLSRGEDVVLPVKTSSYKVWAEKVTQFVESESIHKQIEYWMAFSQGESRSIPTDFANDTSGRQSSAHSISVSLPVEETKQLRYEAPKAHNTQINDLLLTALLQTFSNWTGSSVLEFDLEGHGRTPIIPGVDLSRTVGWFTTLHPLRLALDEKLDLGGTIRSVKEQLRAIPDEGIGYGLLRYLSRNQSVRSRLKTMPRSSVLFNYLGQQDHLLADSKMFKLSRGLKLSRDPNCSRTHLIEINALIVNEQLRIDWTFSCNVYREVTIRRIADTYLKMLTSIIQHCVTSGARGYTPSDFPEADVSQDELDEIIAEFGEIQ